MKWYVSYHLYVEAKKYNKLVNTTKQKQIHRYREQAGGNKWRKGIQEGKYEGTALRGTNRYV